MSITNTDLIADALRLLGVISETETPSAEQGATALRKLNQMLEQWEGNDIYLQYFAQTALSDTCPIPGYAEVGVTAQLAVLLAPIYGATVSTEIAAQVVAGMETISRTAAKELNQPVNLRNRPYGEGQVQRYNITTDT